jgi:hypothetical protein
LAVAGEARRAVIERISPDGDLPHTDHNQPFKKIVGRPGTTIDFGDLCVGVGGIPVTHPGRSAKSLDRVPRGHPASSRLGRASSRRAQGMSVSAYQLRILVVAIVVGALARLAVASIGHGRAASVVSNAPAHDPASVLPATARAAVAAPTVLANADAAPDMLFAPRRGPDDALAIMATLADIYDDTRMSPLWPNAVPSPASLSPAELVRLLGICSGVALCIYSLLAFNLRRRGPFSGRSEPS